MKKLRVGVAGAGVFGNYHAQKAAASAKAELVGIYDVDKARADKVAGTFGAKGFDSFPALLQIADAIVVAVPATYHEALTAEALAGGQHVLVEKPLALNSKSARWLAGQAVTYGRVLQVGHQERFVAKAMGILDIPEPPLLLESVRASPPAPDGRAGDVSVIWDLMIHDLDLAAILIPGEFATVEATGKIVHSGKIDESVADITFVGGARAKLRASRAGEGRERSMRVVYPSGEISVNFLTREVKNSTPYEVRVDIQSQLPDPLGAADESFYAACLGEAKSPVPGYGAVAAVAMAELVEAAALEHAAAAKKG